MENTNNASIRWTYSERIRFFRKMLGMTQKELGMAIGFSESTADTRIAQYENRERSPGQETIDRMAAVFKISPMALMVPDMTMNQTMHVLFALEDRLNFGLEIHEESIHLVFNQSETSSGVFYRMLCWMLKSTLKREPAPANDLYDAWRYWYPAKNNNYPQEYDPESEESFDRVAKVALERRKRDWQEPQV